MLIRGIKNMKKRWNQPGSLFVKPAAPAGTAAPERAWWKTLLHNLRFFKIFRGLSTAIGAMVLISMLAGMIFGAIFQEQEEFVPEQMILTFRLHDGLEEIPAADGFFAGLGSLTERRLSVQEMIEAIDQAATDPRVKALSFSIEGGDFSIARVQELRAAIKRFRASGKPAYAFSPSYAEAGGGMGPYYLAAAFEQIWIQPVGFLTIMGFDAEMPFAAAALKKIGINPQFYQRKEYKSVMENIARENMSPENREMMTSILRDIMDGLVTDIAADRGMAPQAFRLAVDQGVFTDQEAVAAGLVDRIGHGDVLVSEVRKTLSGNPDDENLKLYGLNRYFLNAMADTVPENAPKIGFVHAVGNIVPRSDGGGMGDGIIAADKTASAILKGVKDEGIKAIVLRVDSPGGSPTASETIRRAVERALEKKKPVIVSMGAMAGSGGYWIVTDATRIFAQPATLTGSIGVASGKLEASGLMEKIGVNWDGVQIGRNADMNSIVKPFSEDGDKRMQVMMDSIYAAFTDRVARGRKLTPEKVEAIAKGRVWTGRQALGLGLVDELGGLDAALDYAAKQVGAENRNQVRLVELPRKRTPFDRIFELLNIEVAMGRITGVAMAVLEKKLDLAAMPSVSVSDPFLAQGLK